MCPPIRCQSAAIADIITFNDVKDPELWTRPTEPSAAIEIVDHDPAWADQFAEAAHQIRGALTPSGAFGGIDRVGSTSMPGLPAKPIIDIALVVADPSAEDDYVPALAEAGSGLTLREPVWYEHRMFKQLDSDPGQPGCNLHVFGPRCAEVARMRLFRDRLREHAGERGAYQSVKRTSAAESNAVGETVMGYNARKQAVVREIYHCIFEARGWV
ncbi:GrpB family protein [Brevibacterium sp. CFH 10365]|uniref:GrpB family protein n=1 Tax=Brevibacterium sp. CFH 10365 TaxID=2585207 RepID=UPI001D0D4913|nr:GrpB family protein [Brevibacterium sp. CFH 10365]